MYCKWPPFRSASNVVLTYFLSRVCAGTSVRRLQGKMHGVGSSANCDSWCVRSVLAHTELTQVAPSILPAKCHWWNAVALNTSYCVGQSCTDLVCTVQLASRSDSGHASDRLGFAAIAVQEEPNLHLSSFCVASRVKCCTKFRSTRDRVLPDCSLVAVPGLFEVEQIWCSPWTAVF